MDIELRHLRAFVAVTEELNFTSAAKRLFIAQQALSAQIRQLEDRIGTKLLERTTRSVSLTDAGEVLLSQARLLLADADTVVAATRAAGATRTPPTVGFVAAVNHPEMSHALDLTPLYSEPFGVALAASHHLANAASPTVEDVIAEPTFDFATADRAWRDYWSGAEFRRGGPPARYVAQFRTLEGLIVSAVETLGV